MFQIKKLDGLYFECAENETLLDAALRHEQTWPYSCRTGRCSSCKALVLEGETLATRPETGLTEQELRQGWVLTCVRTPCSDLQVDVEVLGCSLPEQKTLPCRIDSLDFLADDVVRVVLRLPPAQTFEFLPGQYVDVIGSNGLRRSYSLANIGADKKLELHIRCVPDGQMSHYWFNEAKINDLLRLHGPSGTFFLRDVANKDVAFLATGTGIAPVISMLQGLIHLPVESRPRSVTVYWGGRHEQDFYCDMFALIADIRKQLSFEALNFVPVLSRADEGWQGAKGYVQQVLLEDVRDVEQLVVYACGSESMIRDAQQVLMAAGLPLRRFLSDAFVSSGN